MIATKALQNVRLGARSFTRRPAPVLSASTRNHHALIHPARGVTTFPSKSASTAARRQKLSTQAVAHTAASSSSQKKNKLALGVFGGIAIAGLHSATGSQDDFFDYRFSTKKPSDELASFYGGEELMELFCIFPFVGQLMMRNGTFDEDGNVITTGIPGTLKVSMVFSDETSNEETGEIEWFNKRERFRNTLFGWTCWDMVMNFGFRTLEDGRIEVYHYGEYFHGNLPVVSQVMKLVFKTHAQWLAWSTEHHINHYAFTAETDEEEELEEESRKNMPLFLLKHYAWTDLMAMTLGTKEDDGDTSFLVRRKQKMDEKLECLLPIQREATKIQISQDIATDRLTTRGILARNPTQSAESLLSRRYTLNASGQKGNAYGVATEAARLRQSARAATRRSTFKEVAEEATGSSVQTESPYGTEQPRKANDKSLNENRSVQRRPSPHIGS